MHLRREEEVISADDGNAESGRSAEEGAQRVAAARLGAGGMAGRGGTPACPRSSHPHTQAEPRTAGREFWRVSQGRAWRVTKQGKFAPSLFPIVAQRGGAQRAVQDIVPYLRMLVVGDIRARSYATGQQSLGDETTDVGATL